jgi:hypothetical protein
MTLFLVLAVLAVAAFWRQVVAMLAAGLLVLVVLGIVKVTELLHVAGF